MSPENKFLKRGEIDTNRFKDGPKPIFEKKQKPQENAKKEGEVSPETIGQTWPKKGEDIKLEELPAKLEEELAKVREKIQGE